MQIFRSPWKSQIAHDPFVSLSNQKPIASGLMSDRFEGYIPSQIELMSSWKNSQISKEKQGLTSETSNEKNNNYKNLLSKVCKVKPKKQKSLKKVLQYQSKIPRSGYILNETIYDQLQSVEQSRNISQTPYRVLNAPKLKDDFYTNLLDWSRDDTIGVVLDNAAYIWDSNQSQTQKIIEGYISCLKWGKHLTLGEQTGRIRLIDVLKRKQIARHRQHQSRIGTIDCFNNNMIASGSKDSSILIWDVRSQSTIKKIQAHKQQVCGIKWSFDGNYIASGGNDNIVSIWDQRTDKVLYKFSQHTAAIKALAWSPHQHSILATGGGSTDKKIRMWNINQGICIKRVDTGSQVCNMMFSENTNELVSTHGFSLNSINIWSAKSMEKVATLRGHSFRVLYLAKSPDGQSIVTGSGDQTLRFWKVFPRGIQNKGGSILQTKNCYLR